MSTDILKMMGWDIGGVNIKAARLTLQNKKIEDIRVVVRPFEIWHEKEKLPGVLQEIGDELGVKETHAMAVTMTAELSDIFPSKKQGVLSILDAVDEAFPERSVYLLGLSGDLVSLKEARQGPLRFAATNWLASAQFVAKKIRDGILVDVGSTTTDIIPIRDGRVAAQGLTDMARLSSGELVYTGALRTNPNTVASMIPIHGLNCRVSAEYFAVMGDVYVILGYVSPETYSCSTPDGRDKSLQGARERLSRLVCADGDMLSEGDIFKLARYLFEKQLQQIAEALFQVLSRLADGYRLPLVVAGTGSFLVVEIGRRLGMTTVDLVEELGEKAMTALPSLAVAHFLAEQMDEKMR